MTNKAGFIPYIKEDEEFKMMFMKSSDANFGGDKPACAKGIIDDGESTLEAALREAEEELGLKYSNLLKETIRQAWAGPTNNGEHHLTVFIGEVKDKNDFLKPDYETESVHWLSNIEFNRLGKITQRKLVRTIDSLLYFGK